MVGIKPKTASVPSSELSKHLPFHHRESTVRASAVSTSGSLGSLSIGGSKAEAASVLSIVTGQMW